MTTITPFAAGSYVTNRNTSQLLGLKNQLNDLSTQLSTGLTAQTYGGLGTGRSTALAAQATLSALTGYASGINAGQTRTDLAVTSLTQVANLGSSTITTLNNGLQSTPINSTAAKSVAVSNLQTALDALNQSAAGNYLFGGGNSATQPVVDANTILNGATNSDGTHKAGLSDLISDQVTADLGPDKNGRLVQTGPGDKDPADPSGNKLGSNQIALSEDRNTANPGNFGFSIASTPIASTKAISVQSTTASGAKHPVSFTLSVGSQPSVAAGDNVSLTLKMPDGTSTTLTLTAVASGTASSVSNTGATFAIDSDPNVTASNLSSALSGALSAAANSTLTANSTQRAAANFFSGSVDKGVFPERIKDPSGTPTYVTGTANDTVIWYQGEDKTADARSTQSVQVSSTSKITTGVRANEPAIKDMLTGLATVAYGLPTASNANTGAAYQAVVDQAAPLLSGANQSSSVQDIVSELSNSSAQITNAGTRNTATQNIIQNTLDGIEQAPTEEVVAKLLDVQNRLQASYQITSSLSKLSLVNYIS